LSEDAQFSAREIIDFLAKAGTDLDICIVGGQALNIWAEALARDIAPPKPMSGLTSKDLDFFGPAAAARELASRTAGRLLVPSLDDHTPSTAIVQLNLDEKRLRIDFISSVLGVESREVLPKSAKIVVPAPDGTEIALRLMHPVHCLQSRAANILHPATGRRDQIALLQYKASVRVVRAWIKRALRVGFPRVATDSISMLGKFLMSDHIGRAVHLRLRPDPLAILKAAVRYAALDERYRDHTLRSMIARIEKRRDTLATVQARRRKNT